MSLARTSSLGIAAELAMVMFSPVGSDRALAGAQRSDRIAAITFQAWLYPAPKGSQECSAEGAFSNEGLKRGVLKVEYMDASARGRL
jgi:hypothetical protein